MRRGDQYRSLISDQLKTSVEYLDKSYVISSLIYLRYDISLNLMYSSQTSSNILSTTSVYTLSVDPSSKLENSLTFQARSDGSITNGTIFVYTWVRNPKAPSTY